jgi:hypothetical protein
VKNKTSITNTPYLSMLKLIVFYWQCNLVDSFGKIYMLCRPYFLSADTYAALLLNLLAQVCNTAFIWLISLWLCAASEERIRCWLIWICLECCSTVNQRCCCETCSFKQNLIKLSYCRIRSVSMRKHFPFHFFFCIVWATHEHNVSAVAFWKGNVTETWHMVASKILINWKY